MKIGHDFLQTEKKKTGFGSITNLFSFQMLKVREISGKNFVKQIVENI